MAKSKHPKKDVYQTVTNSIIAALEKGTTPWVKPWTNSDKQVGCQDLPSNAVSGNNYRGVNTMLLWASQVEHGYQSNTWMTFKQAKDLGGNVLKGEKSTPVIFFNMLKRKDPVTGEDVNIPMLKDYRVFNVEQCEGLNGNRVKVPEKIDIEYTDALNFAEQTGAKVQHGGDQAFCSRRFGHIQMPYLEYFKDVESYEATILHELTHWSGHKPRLNREFGTRFGDAAYAFEELVAEIGSAFLCSTLGLKNEALQHEEYIAAWLQVLKADKKAIFKAATLAQKASDYLIGLQPNAKALAA